MKILHFADVHLDRPFVGLPPRIAETQRRRLMDAFRRLVALAETHAVDLVTIGGDLWEEEHVSADTRASVAHALGQLSADVLVICGNHDPLLPGGSYHRTTWPSNVTIAPIRALRRFDYGDVAIWAVSWGGSDLSARALDHLEIPSDGATHLALLHGTAPTAPFAENTEAYFPFDPAVLHAAGIQGVLAGHIHQASHQAGVVYPGSPEPLGWGETGRHCAALVDISDGGVDVELVDVNQTSFRTCEISCDGCGSSEEVVGLLRAIEPEEGTLVRVRLTGEVASDCDLEPQKLAEAIGRGFAFVQVEDRTEPSLDIERRRQRRSLDGLFVRKLLERIELANDEATKRQAQLALEAGLRALEGRERLLYVD